MRLGGIMRLKVTSQTRRTLWLNQLRAAKERAEACEAKLERQERRLINRGDDSISKKAFERFINYCMNQGARNALIEVLEDEGTLEESVGLTVEYYAQEL